VFVGGGQGSLLPCLLFQFSLRCTLVAKSWGLRHHCPSQIVHVVLLILVPEQLASTGAQIGGLSAVG
jgi:hypothetical protein